MAFRIGSLVFYPDALFLPLAGLFLLVLAAHGLREHRFGRKERWIILAGAAVGGVVGGWLYGLPGALARSAASDALPTASALLTFGSLGGYWGVLVGAAFAGGRFRGRGLAAADSCIQGLAWGGAVARVACFFQGCCSGIVLDGAPWFAQPSYLWPGFDVVALLAAAFLAQRPANPVPGLHLAWFLLIYHPLRFVAEFARETDRVAFGLTVGQFLALFGAFAGTLLLCRLFRRCTGGNVLRSWVGAVAWSAAPWGRAQEDHRG